MNIITLILLIELQRVNSIVGDCHCEIRENICWVENKGHKDFSPGKGKK